MSSLNKDHTLVDRIRIWGETDPETPAFIFWSPEGRHVLTRGDVLDLSSRFAFRLREHGIRPGDVVCISLPNCPERIVAEYGVHLAGAVSMNGQVLRADGEDLAASLINARCVCIIVDQNQDKGAWELCQAWFENINKLENHAKGDSKRIPSLKSVIFTYPDFFSDLVKEGKFIYVGGMSTSPAVIFTTSGSTGYSKLVEHSHSNLLSALKICDDNLGLDCRKTFLSCSPLGWVGGYPGHYLICGCIRIMFDERNELTNKHLLVWDLIQREKVEFALLTPLMLMSAPKQASQDGKRNLHILTGGQPVKQQHLESIRHITKKVIVAYGATEFVLATCCIIDCLNNEIYHDFEVGFPFEDTRIKIVDKDQNSLPPLSRGELLVKSPTLCISYIGLQSPDSFLPDGWFRTGDIGYMRADGCLFVEGRSADAIMHGPYILYPSWLEEMLVKCPGVEEVVIVPVPDKVLHHEICACVKLDKSHDAKPSAEDIINFCQKETLLKKSSSLSVVPKYVLFFDDFPKTNTYKLHRRALALQASEKLGLSQ